MTMETPGRSSEQTARIRMDRGTGSGEGHGFHIYDIELLVYCREKNHRTKWAMASSSQTVFVVNQVLGYTGDM